MDNIGGILVTVFCMVYNHEKYIRKCLDGFVMQKGVSFEVLVHDDASTDHSADIIREYEEKYPGIIKPIYQKENQYSQKVPIESRYLCPLAKGKYIAICEGDDYWTDPYKLKKQYDALEAHPECTFCTHEVQVVRESGEMTDHVIPNTEIPGGYISKDRFFKEIWVKNRFPFHISGYFIRACEFKEYALNPPAFDADAPVGDVPLILYFTYQGGVFFIKEKMSCYRTGSIDSWNQRFSKRTAKEKIRHYNRMLKLYDSFREFTNGTVDVSPAMEAYGYFINLVKEDYKSAWHYVRKDPGLCTMREKIVIFTRAYVPWLYFLYKKVF